MFWARRKTVRRPVRDKEGERKDDECAVMVNGEGSGKAQGSGSGWGTRVSPSYTAQVRDRLFKYRCSSNGQASLYHILSHSVGRAMCAVHNGAGKGCHRL